MNKLIKKIVLSMFLVLYSFGLNAQRFKSYSVEFSTEKSGWSTVSKSVIIHVFKDRVDFGKEVYYLRDIFDRRYCINVITNDTIVYYKYNAIRENKEVEVWIYKNMDKNKIVGIEIKQLSGLGYIYTAYMGRNKIKNN